MIRSVRLPSLLLLALLGGASPAPAGDDGSGARLGRLRGVRTTEVVVSESDIELGELLSRLTHACGLELELTGGDWSKRRVAYRSRGENVRSALDQLAREHCLAYRTRGRRKLVAGVWSELCRQPFLVPIDRGLSVPASREVLPPGYPARARAGGYEGRLAVEIEIDRYGNAKPRGLLHCDLRPVPGALPEQFEDVCAELYAATRQAITKWRFGSPLRDGQPVAGRYRAHLVFRVE